MPSQNTPEKGDGKAFGTPPTFPTDFGQFAAEEASQPGSDPGSKQVPAPKFSPENGN